ncbi:MAG: class I SAM-dependent methyltransferase [Acidobacteriota bacterium]|nr:class I SAM-dependent methyltransferase [Acidobacteriota bacterium]
MARPFRSNRSSGTNGGDDVVRHSLALPFIFEQLRQRPGQGVLDLGPAAGSNLETLAALGCRLHVTDLYRGLAEANAAHGDNDGSFGQVCDELLPPAGGEPYEVILAWDVLDYLGRPELTALMQRLIPLCHSGTQLFCMVSIRRQIPARPLAYRILAPDRLAAIGNQEATRPGPRYHQPDLLRAMPGFEVRKSFLLRHGMQEYLLTYRPEDAHEED